MNEAILLVEQREISSKVISASSCDPCGQDGPLEQAVEFRFRRTEWSARRRLRESERPKLALAFQEEPAECFIRSGVIAQNHIASVSRPVLAREPSKFYSVLGRLLEPLT